MVTGSSPCRKKCNRGSSNRRRYVQAVLKKMVSGATIKFAGSLRPGGHKANGYVSSGSKWQFAHKNLTPQALAHSVALRVFAEIYSGPRKCCIKSTLSGFGPTIAKLWCVSKVVGARSEVLTYVVLHFLGGPAPSARQVRVVVPLHSYPRRGLTGRESLYRDSLYR